jgi:hypothetical protein
LDCPVFILIDCHTAQLDMGTCSGGGPPTLSWIYGQDPAPACCWIFSLHTNEDIVQFLDSNGLYRRPIFL